MRKHFVYHLKFIMDGHRTHASGRTGLRPGDGARPHGGMLPAPPRMRHSVEIDRDRPIINHGRR
jgi:hypothetical protein